MVQFEVALSENLPIEGVVLSDQVKSLDFSILEVSFICKVPNSVLQSVKKNIMALVG